MILEVLKATNCGIIYQDVELPKTGLQETGQSSDVRRIGDLQLMEDDTGEPQASELLDGRRTSRIVPGC
uniref:Uncharacterized protein n=1 Tax=Arundo donax TaxID=35708 RepID=A0A0A9EEU9_ARUDO